MDGEDRRRTCYMVLAPLIPRGGFFMKSAFSLGASEATKRRPCAGHKMRHLRFILGMRFAGFLDGSACCVVSPATMFPNRHSSGTHTGWYDRTS
jgi:hypothetical protein